MPMPPPPNPRPPPRPCWARAGPDNKATNPSATHVLLRVLMACNSLMQADGQYRALGSSGLPRTRNMIRRDDGRMALHCSTAVLSDADDRVDRSFLEMRKELPDS